MLNTRALMQSGSMVKAIVAVARWAGAVLLGLPVTLLAHSLRYGSEHSAGSTYHAHFLQAAFAASALLMLVLVLRAVRAARRGCRQKLVLARVQRLVPGWSALALSSVAWFALVERLDAHPHGVPVSALLAIALAAFVLQAVTRLFSRAVTCAAIAALAQRIAPHTGERLNGDHSSPQLIANAFRFRLFARPPPTFA